jgi:AcrR family transcriptional regulator
VAAVKVNLDEIEGVHPAFQARSRDARARLLKAGEQVFAKMGYDAAHVSDIAAAAQCSIGSFYGRFRDKEALFHALQTQFALRGVENVEKFFAMPQWQEAEIPVVLRTLVHNTARAIQRHPGFFRALFQRSLAGAGHIYFPAMRVADENAGRLLARFLSERGIVLGPDMENTCTFALQAVEAVLIHRMLHGLRAASITDPELVDHLSRMLISFLGLADLVPKP